MPDFLRRPIAARETAWAAATARWLARNGVRPNLISLLSVVFAAAGGACLASLRWIDAPLTRIVCLVGAIAGIQLRLLCNLFDGMVAIEEGRKTPSGAIYNELPDRFADAFVLVGAGYAGPSPTWSVELGWLAAVLAIITAYVRALGGSVGAGQHFVGPMAKQHRMALLTAACVVAIALEIAGRSPPILAWSLVIVAAGCVLTIVRRCRLIVLDLEAK
jgi:phosphatidylglycerophosphate synthase